MIPLDGRRLDDCKSWDWRRGSDSVASIALGSPLDGFLLCDRLEWAVYSLLVMRSDHMTLIQRLCFGLLFTLYFTAGVLNIRRMSESSSELIDWLNLAVIGCGMAFLAWRFGVEFWRVTRNTRL
jgi:hypothetical protein